MLPVWVRGYIGHPFERGGRGPETYDCWGICREALTDEFGLEDLPDHRDGYASTRDPVVALLFEAELRQDWIPVGRGDQHAGDVVVFLMAGRPVHVGLIVTARAFLSSEQGSHSAVWRLADPRWRGRVAGIYRHRSLA